MGKRKTSFVKIILAAFASLALIGFAFAQADGGSIVVAKLSLSQAEQAIKDGSLSLDLRTSYVNPSLNFDSVAVSRLKWPVRGRHVTSPYGSRKRPCPTCSAFHRGIDIDTSGHEPVYAAGEGFVSFAREGFGTCGLNLEIDHGTGAAGKKVSSGYCHLHKLVARSGHVNAGQLIAYSGGGLEDPLSLRGASTGTHLHFYVKEGGNFVNPARYLRK